MTCSDRIVYIPEPNAKPRLVDVLLLSHTLSVCCASLVPAVIYGLVN